MTVTNQPPYLSAAVSCSLWLLDFCVGHRHEWTDADVMNVFGECCCLVTAHLDIATRLSTTYAVGTYCGLCNLSPGQRDEHNVKLSKNLLLIFFRTSETE